MTATLQTIRERLATTRAQLEALEGTEAGPGWVELQEAAAARQRAPRAPRAAHRPRHASRRAHGVRWTAAGQTNQNLARLTSWAARPGMAGVVTLASAGHARSLAAWMPPRGAADQPDDDDKITHNNPPGPEKLQPTNSTSSKWGENNAEKIENSPHDLTFKISSLQLLVNPCGSS